MAQARREVESVMREWAEHIKAGDRGPQMPGPLMMDPAAVQMIVGRLVSSQILLLRAIEELEARPWWRRRRFNPYARR